ncbi:uncharacterized protein JCM6883_004916 [Sporobolomyces salmoneus]|uniref:uncharacterized protein n=1 Tax=Sporobolomyces salmoneus TaxID=183962 RepID=UPI00317F006C
MSLSTPRQRPPTSSSYSTPAHPSSSTPRSSTRQVPRPPHLAFSPTSTLRSVSAQSVPSYAPSLASTSFPHHTTSRYLSSSSAASVAPSNATTTAGPGGGGSTRFRRGHARTKPGGVGVSSVNPETVDLMALEEPDQVFRMFGVRDVRKLEQRASDAANAKVAELRTMVGERYRDLLSAADSIVRMRGAADKLLDRLQGVEEAVFEAGNKINDSAKERRPSLIATQADPSIPKTLADPPTLSLTLHLFLNLSSLVHSLIEQSKFLPAARFENLGRVVWRELEEYKSNPDETDEGGEGEGRSRSVKESFPIVVRHHESMGQLGPLIVRRATTQLRTPDLDSNTVAQILAALILLDHASPSSALSIFLKSRTHALSTLLAAPRVSTSKSANEDSSAVQAKVEKVLDCVLKTVEAVDSIFTSSSPLLPQLLREIEHPSSSSTSSSEEENDSKLSPILSTLPNYPTLQRHLPPSILSYNPFLSSSSSSSPLAKESISTSLSEWFESATDSLLSGIDESLTSLLLETPQPALALSSLRDSILLQLSRAPPAAKDHARKLEARLLGMIEGRLNGVYTLKLEQLVDSIEPILRRSLLSKLSLSEAEAEEEFDSAKFLFSLETPGDLIPPPLPISSASKSTTTTSDPFVSFMTKLGKRVIGRTPLIDEGLETLEEQAKQITGDLGTWLTGDGNGGERGDLRDKYVEQVGKTLEGVVGVLERLLGVEETNEEQGITNTLFIGTFARHLSLSRSFTRDLFLGVPPSAKSILENWQSRLSDLQAHSLRLWQQDAVRRAIELLRKGAESRTHDEVEGPNEPSACLLQALNSLLNSLRRLPLHRLHSDPSPAATLLREFSNEALEVVGELDGVGERRRSSLVWDSTLISLIVDGEEREKWKRTITKLSQSLPPGTDREEIAQSATNWLLRTQSIYSPFFPSPSPLPLSIPADPKLARSTNRLLALGPPPPTSQKDFKSLLRVVQPGQRFGLLPTKG